MNITTDDLRQMLARRDGPKAARSTKRSKRQPWTTPEDATLREQMTAGTSPPIIAFILNRSYGSVKAQAVVLGLTLPATTMRERGRRNSGGRRAALGGLYVRSSWEASYGSYLNYLRDHGEITKWEYEPKTFHFEAVKRGTRDYTPDFRVEYHDGRHEWHEVKGYMDKKSATRLKRMAKYYPNETVRVINSAWFAEARRSGLAGLVPGWERGER